MILLVVFWLEVGMWLCSCGCSNVIVGGRVS